MNNVVELCTQLDVNGDGIVTWDAMFEFTVELGKSGSKVMDAPFLIIQNAKA